MEKFKAAINTMFASALKDCDGNFKTDDDMHEKQEDILSSMLLDISSLANEFELDIE